MSETLLVWGTFALAVVTAWMACETRRMVKESKASSFRLIGVQTWLELQRRFDSREMVIARKKFAKELKAYDASKYNQMSDSVPNFFEDVGGLYKNGYIDKKMAEDSFGLYAVRYWEAAKPYIDQQRRHYGADDTLYEHFGSFADACRTNEERINEDGLQRFLTGEVDL